MLLLFAYFVRVCSVCVAHGLCLVLLLLARF